MREDRHRDRPADDSLVRTILEGTSSETGEDFFKALVSALARALQVSGAWVTEFYPSELRLSALAFWHNGRFIPEYNYAVPGTPCERAIQQRELVHFPDNVIHLFPDDPDLSKLEAVSYMGAPLLDREDNIIGHLAVLDSKAMPGDRRLEWLFRIFASRAAAELRRIRAEQATREKEQQLSRLIDSAMDAIIQLNGRLDIIGGNPSAERVFGENVPSLKGRPVRDLMEPASFEKVRLIASNLAVHGRQQSHLWVSGGLEAKTADGTTFAAEASLSTFRHKGEPYFTLILRSHQEQVDADKRVTDLLGQAEYLREELIALGQRQDMIGDSPAMHRVYRAIDQVAPTDATVLLFGETGTGKEVVARAIHRASRRSARLLVKVNCASLPATLIESELFGHEKGAFTGATQRRQGRFALADGGTIFLDEIGELPLDLQAKLLRVLQEGEFEPVGSSRTCRVDVRLIAATNRDLEAEVAAGRFRRDLFYRLNVFPISIPPLRERGNDIILMAEAFATELCRQMSRPIRPLSPAEKRYLMGYHWPGNVRELQNIVERAVIISPDGNLNLTAILQTPQTSPPSESDRSGQPAHILTADELRELERRNIMAALEQTDGRVSGNQGAALLLGMPASTLASRIKTLGITRS